MRKGIARLLVAGLVLTLVFPGGSETAEAAGKPKLNKKSVTLKVGKSVTLKVKNKTKKVKVTWKSKNKKIARVTKRGKVTGLKKGRTRIICNLKKGKKKTKLVCKVTVKEKENGKTILAPPQRTEIPQSPSGTKMPISSHAPMPPLQTAIPAPAGTPESTYHPDWPSGYTDTYLSLKELSATFKVGSAIAGSSEELAAIYDPDMRGILQKHYDSTTFTNLMKPVFLLDEEGSKASADGMPVVNFDSCKKELQFCKDTGIQLRGHVLVWYNQTPDWFFYENYDTTGKLVDKETMKCRMESYIKQVVTYVQTNYPGVVYCWDVVNEAVGDDGKIRTANNNWYKVYAEGQEKYDAYEYVKDAFTYARKYVEPGVSLVYNDYNTFEPDKRAEILRMIAYVNEGETLIDAMGMQSPILPQWPYIKATDDLVRSQDACVQYAIEDFAKTGLEIMITELCVRTNGGNTKKEMETQAARYQEMYQLLLDMDEENGGPANITSVTTFGIADSYRLYDESVWTPGDESRYGWLFDRNCKAKLAFKCVYNVFARAAGKDTVEETYERPGGDEEETIHTVHGYVKSKNGLGIPDIYMSFEGSDETYYDLETDANGYYSVQLPEGTYNIFGRYISQQSIAVSSESDAIVEKNIILNDNFYSVTGQICSANGKPISGMIIDVNMIDESGVACDWIYLEPDEKGMFTAIIREGNYCIPDESGLGTIDFAVNQEYTKESPLKIESSKLAYEFKADISNLDYSKLKADADWIKIVLCNEDISYWIDDRDGSAVQDVLAGDYRIQLFIGYGAIDTAEMNFINVYYGDISIKKDAEIQIGNSDIIEVQLVPDNDVKIRDCEIGDYYYICNENKLLVGPVSGTIKGLETVYNETLDQTRIYRFSVPFDAAEAISGKLKLNVKMDECEIPALELGKETDTTTEDFADEGNYMKGKLLYSFVPAESGSYTVYTNSGIGFGEDRSLSCEITVRNGNMEYIDTAWSEDNVDVRCSFEAVAGKTYYFEVSCDEVQGMNLPFPIGIKKTE